MFRLQKLLRVAALLPFAGFVPHLWASDAFVAGTIGTCQPVTDGEACGISFLIYPGTFTEPANWQINSISFSFEIVNNSDTDSVAYSLGVNQDPSIPLYYPFLGTLSPGQDLNTTEGPFTNGDPGTSPPGHGTPSPLNFADSNWISPVDGVLSSVIFNDSSTGDGNLTLESITLDINYSEIPEPASVGLILMGLLMCSALPKLKSRI